MSAEKKRSNGAPFDSWAKKFPDEPKESFTVFPVFFSNPATISLNAKFRSDAAAIESSPACESSGMAPTTMGTSRMAVTRKVHVFMIFPLIPELDLRGEEVFVIGVGDAPASCDERIPLVLVVLELVVQRELHVRVQVVVETDRVPCQRAVLPVRINSEFFVAIRRLEPRQERERPEQDVLIPCPAPEAIVIALNVLSLQLQLRQERWNVGVHDALPGLLDVGVVLQWT